MDPCLFVDVRRIEGRRTLGLESLCALRACYRFPGILVVDDGG
jgi:hypothetical protein